MLCLIKFRFGSEWTKQLLTVGSLLHAQQCRAVHLVLPREQILILSTAQGVQNATQPGWDGGIQNWTHWEPFQWLWLLFRSVKFFTSSMMYRTISGHPGRVEEMAEVKSITNIVQMGVTPNNKQKIMWHLSENCLGAVSPALNLDLGSGKRLLHPKHLSQQVIELMFKNLDWWMHSYYGYLTVSLNSVSKCDFIFVSIQCNVRQNF